MSTDSKSGANRQGGGTQGGTHEQHVEAGRQSHKISNGASRMSLPGCRDACRTVCADDLAGIR